MLRCRAEGFNAHQIRVELKSSFSVPFSFKKKEPAGGTSTPLLQECSEGFQGFLRVGALGVEFYVYALAQS